MAKLLYGKPVADAILAEAAERASRLRERGIVPALAFVRTGSSLSSGQYERQALEACDAAHVEAYSAFMPDSSRLTTTLTNINRDDSIHGVIFLRPMPDEAAEDYLRNNLDPRKDIDGVTLSSLASIFVGHGRAFVPCPAKAVLELLKYYNVPLEGRRVLLVGCSLYMGKPLSMLLLRNEATVTLCSPSAPDLCELCRGSDIIVSGVGVPGTIGADCLREGQTVLDVGNSLIGKGHAGDLDEQAALAAGTDVAPVTGGVDVVSYAMLALHTVQAAEVLHGLL